MQRFLLALIVFVYVIVAALYAVRTPIWQAPDEPAHFNYIRAIGDTGALPILQPGDYDQDYLEQIKARKFPAGMSIDAIRYESYQPPLYYLSAVPVYLAARAGGLDAQVLALRLYSVLLGVIVLFLAWTVVREVFPGDALMPLATAGLMATIPMHVAVTASISNDTAAELVVAALLLLAVRRAKNTVSDRRFVVLGGILFGAALLIKSTAYATGGVLLVAAELVRELLCAAPGKGDARRWQAPLARLVVLFLVALAIAAPMFIRNVLTYGPADPLGMGRHDAIVVGQPTTAEMIAQYGLAHILFDFLAVTFKSFWAQFGWMGVLVNDRIYVVLFVLSGLGLYGLGLYAARILRRRDELTSEQWAGLGLLVLLALVGVVDYVGYQFKFFQLQGRYLFPAIIPIAFLLAAGWRELIARSYVRLTFALLYVALVGLDIASLFLYIIPQLKT